MSSIARGLEFGEECVSLLERNFAGETWGNVEEAHESVLDMLFVVKVC